MNAHSLEKLSLMRKVAIVTGSTQGLGEPIAHLLAERGAAGLVICGRARGYGVQHALHAKGAMAAFVEADLSKVEDARAVVAAADSAFGGPAPRQQRRGHGSRHHSRHELRPLRRDFRREKPIMGRRTAG